MKEIYDLKDNQTNLLLPNGCGTWFLIKGLWVQVPPDGEEETVLQFLLYNILDIKNRQ